jgi:CheY-like chemotaxis protein
VTRPKVLFVDDSREAREVYAECLRDAGWEPRSVGSGAEAVAVAAAFAPNVIVMDLSMPGVDGLEATRRLKSDARTSQVPVVALTAFAGRAGEALAAGCAEFLTKPCEAEDLVAVIEKVARTAADEQ